MDGQVELPVSLQKAQKSLGLCIKQRHEASKIRQVLSSHLGSQLNSSGHPLNRPLSLVDPAIDVEAASHGVRGLQREYLRSVRANIKARNEYAAISKEHHARRTGEDLESETQDFPQQSNSCPGMEAFIYLTMHQQKHERLRITQDYVDVLSQKPAATAEHLDPKVALRDVDSLPKVPPEVLHNASAGPAAGGTALKELVDLLEKSVLRAKMLLKKEQRLLAKVRADSSGSPESRGDRLQALGLTRNALINWIEAEMEKAGDGSVDVEDEELSNHDAGGKDYIEAQLASIQRQYGRYIEARQSLVTSATSISEPPVSTTKEEDSHVPALTGDSRPSQGMQIFYPYLEKLAFTANEQKAAIQQRSHLTISLAKQVKEASQGLDRLADESHLLPAHPMPTASSQRKGLEGPLSFNGELLNHEKPDSSARGRAWVYAAESAGTATKNVITEQLEEGGKAMEESRNSVSGLYHLLGYETQDDGLRKTGLKKDIWTALDGALGVIKGDGAEAG